MEICTVGVTVTANAFQLSFLVNETSNYRHTKLNQFLQVARSKLGDHDIPLYVHYVTYFLCAVFRIFLPCYFGNLVLSASEALQIRLYSSGWLDMSIVCRRKLIILMERMKRPTVIWAWVLFPLTLAIFKSVNTRHQIGDIRVEFHKFYFFVDSKLFVYDANVATKFQLIRFIDKIFNLLCRFI